jgi:hypothetical protein
MSMQSDAYKRWAKACLTSEGCHKEHSNCLRPHLRLPSCTFITAALIRGHPQTARNTSCCKCNCFLQSKWAKIQAVCCSGIKKVLERRRAMPYASAHTHTHKCSLFCSNWPLICPPNNVVIVRRVVSTKLFAPFVGKIEFIHDWLLWLDILSGFAHKLK